MSCVLPASLKLNDPETHYREDGGQRLHHILLDVSANVDSVHYMYCVEYRRVDKVRVRRGARNNDTKVAVRG